MIDPSTIENGSWVPTVEGYDAYIWHSVGRTCFTGVVEGEKEAWSCDWNCDGTTWGKKGWFNLNWLGWYKGLETEG